MVAIYYHPDAYEVAGPKLMGRTAAGASFLRGLLQHYSEPDICVFADSPEYAENVSRLSSSIIRAHKIHFCDTKELGSVQPFGTLHFPAPSISDLARKRAVFGDNFCSLSGIAHTTASANAIQDISNLVTGPVRRWDALICPSNSVKKHIDNLIEAKKLYIKERFSGYVKELPQLPVIPIGITASDFEVDTALRHSTRQRFSIGEEDIAVLYVGRLSFHAKSHPFPFYAALQEVASRVSQKIHVIECGWHHNEFIKDSFIEAQKQIAPSISFNFLDGRDSRNVKAAWSSGDIFCSFSDNLQETFGITPIEAMASAMPLVVSDWDGYRESVRDGVDGFLVPTTMPKEGSGGILSNSFLLENLNYDQYCGYTCSTISVSISGAIKAFEELIGSRELRLKMGESGKRRAQASYDWKAIIPQYEELWLELSKIRRSEDSTESLPLLPERIDPFTAFSHYASSRIDLDTIIVSHRSSLESFIEHYRQVSSLGSVNFAESIIPDAQKVTEIYNAVRTESKTVRELLKNLYPSESQTAILELCWMIKYNLITTL